MPPHQVTRTAYCNSCQGDRAHAMVYTERKSEHDGQDEDGAENWVGDRHHMLLKCSCGDFRLLDLFDEGHDQYETYYPPRAPRRAPDWMNSVVFVDPEVAFVPQLARELYVALQHGGRRLVAAGVRSLIEQIAVQQNGTDAGSFAANLGQLQKKGHLTPLQRDRVMTVIDAGSAAIHRGYAPSEEDLITMLEITEQLVTSVYFHGASVAELARRIPSRPPKAPQSPTPAASAAPTAHKRPVMTAKKPATSPADPT
jgi:hypothetical protein